MKKLFSMVSILVAICTLAGCNSSKQVGGIDVPCIGAFDEKDPRYVYKVDGWNVAMGIIFFEVIVPPVVVLADETLCPARLAPGASK